MTMSAKQKAQLLQQRQLAELLNSIDPPRNAALPKQESEIVQPSQMSVWARGAYEPPKQESVRRGADDHFKYKSKGI